MGDFVFMTPSCYITSSPPTPQKEKRQEAYDWTRKAEKHLLTSHSLEQWKDMRDNDQALYAKCVCDVALKFFASEAGIRLGDYDWSALIVQQQDKTISDKASGMIALVGQWYPEVASLLNLMIDQAAQIEMMFNSMTDASSSSYYGSTPEEEERLLAGTLFGDQRALFC